VTTREQAQRLVEIVELLLDADPLATVEARVAADAVERGA
jgi:hypothetical protein